MSRVVRDRPFILAAVLALGILMLAISAQAQSITWKVDGPASCTVTCTAAVVLPIPPGPPQPPVPATDPCAQWAGNFMLYSYCRQGVVTSGPPAVIGGGQPSDGYSFTGFNLERKGHPYSNRLEGGYTYQYVIDTATGERVELTILEVVGTPDSMSVVSRVNAASGAVVSPPAASGRHGKHEFVSPGGRLTLFLTPSVSGELGVQRN